MNWPPMARRPVPDQSALAKGGGHQVPMMAPEAIFKELGYSRVLGKPHSSLGCDTAFSCHFLSLHVLLPWLDHGNGVIHRVVIKCLPLVATPFSGCVTMSNDVVSLSFHLSIRFIPSHVEPPLSCLLHHHNQLVTNRNTFCYHPGSESFYPPWWVEQIQSIWPTSPRNWTGQRCRKPLCDMRNTSTFSSFMIPRSRIPQ